MKKIFNFLFGYTKIHPLVGKTVVYSESEGCQAMNVIKWVGIISRVSNAEDRREIAHVDIKIFNRSYGDSRDKCSRQEWTHKISVKDSSFQNVEGIQVMFY